MRFMNPENQSVPGKLSQNRSLKYFDQLSLTIVIYSVCGLLYFKVILPWTWSLRSMVPCTTQKRPALISVVFSPPPLLFVNEFRHNFYSLQVKFSFCNFKASITKKFDYLCEKINTIIAIFKSTPLIRKTIKLWVGRIVLATKAYKSRRRRR